MVSILHSWLLGGVKECMCSTVPQICNLHFWGHYPENDLWGLKKCKLHYLRPSRKKKSTDIQVGRPSAKENVTYIFDVPPVGMLGTGNKAIGYRQILLIRIQRVIIWIRTMANQKNLPIAETKPDLDSSLFDRFFWESKPWQTTCRRWDTFETIEAMERYTTQGLLFLVRMNLVGFGSISGTA